jgi:hypothetical protein
VTQIVARLSQSGSVDRLSHEYFFYALKDYGYGGSVSWGRVEDGSEGELFLSKLDVSSYVYGFSKKYELSVIDSDGRILRLIEGSPVKPAFTPEERNRFKIGWEVTSKPFFFRLWTDSKGRIYVQRNKTYIYHNKVDMIVDIFSPKGLFLYTSNLPPDTCQIANGYLYTYEVDKSTGLEFAKRFKIMNWDQMRTGVEMPEGAGGGK